MDNSCFLDCEIVPENNICVQVDNTTVISREYTGVDTDDVDITIDNSEYTISVTIKPTWVNSASDLPEVGSANVIYGIRNDSKFAVWDSANSEYAFFGYVLTATEKTKLGTLIDMLDNDQFGNVDDVKIDNSSVVDGNKIAQFLTINGNYNASTNKLATQSDLPTQASDVHALPDSTKYGASLDLENGSTLQLKDQDGNDLGNPVTISTEDTGATSVEVTGNGNAVTEASYSSAERKITLTKGTNFATSSELTGVNNRVTAIEGKIPSEATSSNQLADKQFVNSSIATATATFRGTYNLVSDLSLTTNATEQQIATALLTAISTADNNDYCFVQIPTSDATPTEIARIDRYKFNGTSWSFEYSLNNSGFTASQWAAINSGATTTNISQIGTNTSDISSLNTNKVNKTTTIAGVDLQDNITKSELLTALNVNEGAEVNVQPDWNQTDTSADDYIKNKPTITTVNDATVTITTDGSTLGSFTVNQSSNSTIDLGIQYGLLRLDE